MRLLNFELSTLFIRNKFSFLLLIMSVGLSYCSQPKEKNALTNIGPAWIASLNRQDFGQILNFYADNVELESPNWDGIKKGKAGVREVYGRYFSSTPNIRFVLSHSSVADSSIVLEYVTSGLLSNPEKGTPGYMLGKQYTLKNISLFDMQVGRSSARLAISTR
jgi:hypothetical protein